MSGADLSSLQRMSVNSKSQHDHSTHELNDDDGLDDLSNYNDLLLPNLSRPVHGPLASLAKLILDKETVSYFV